MNAAFAFNVAKVREAIGGAQKRLVEQMGRDVGEASKAAR